MKYYTAGMILLLAIVATRSPAPAADAPPIFYCDLTRLFSLDLKDEAARHRFWDETHLAAAIQGLANRQSPRLFLRYVTPADDFWWEQMTRPGGWLAGRPVVKIQSIEEMLQRFGDAYRGAVVWDDRVAATSNLASTIAGCDDLLPLRFDPREGSLYRRLTDAGTLKIKLRLLREDGSPLFTGQGKIPNTQQDSTGSAKDDGYRWLIEHYVKTGKADPRVMGYYLDGYWHQSWRASGPANHTLTNHDFVIARRGVLFDLNVWDDEPCIDDPNQKPGADVAMLKEILRAAYDRIGPDGVIHAAGFVPWAFKYTHFHGAGGRHPEVATEWRYAEILSCFNAYMDGDALGLGAMANASFFQHYPLAPRYEQNAKPTRETLTARGLLDAAGRIAPRRYVAHYVGDYDSAAWLYHELPRMWRDPARGSTPLSWAFNPCLAMRFPLGMAWAREHRTPNDWFIAGDSGAGYLNPGYLTEPRPHSNLPSGLPAWEKYCTKLYRQWDLSVTGFIIDGYARGLDDAGLDAFARFSPDGIVAQRITRQGIHGAMPFLKMATDLHGTPAEAARSIAGLNTGKGPRFTVCRSILQTPSWYAQVEKQLKDLAGDQIQIVDLYTLMWLVREYESHRDAYVDLRYAHAKQVTATPANSDGLASVSTADGNVKQAVQDGAPCWRISNSPESRYLYFDIDDAFYRAGTGPIEITVEYWDHGRGRLLLQYDSTDGNAPVGGAYKNHATTVDRANTSQWRTAAFELRDARFAGSQNGAADFRLSAAPDDLLVRRVTITRK